MQRDLFSTLDTLSTDAIIAEIRRRYQTNPPRPKVRRPADILPAVERWIIEPVEYFLVCTLDGAHTVINTHVVSQGLVNRTVVHPREVLRPAIIDAAAAIILAHNHPSGALEPSAEDIEVTRRMTQAAAIIGIPILDHVIVGKAGYYSFLEHENL